MVEVVVVEVVMSEMVITVTLTDGWQCEGGDGWMDDEKRTCV